VNEKSQDSRGQTIFGKEKERNITENHKRTLNSTVKQKSDRVLQERVCSSSPISSVGQGTGE
jgi:hypothetical protein